MKFFKKSLNLLFVSNLHNHLVVGLVHEFRGLTRNGAIDQVFVQRWEGNVQPTSVERGHYHSIVAEKILRAQAFEFHTAGRGDAEGEEHKW